MNVIITADNLDRNELINDMKQSFQNLFNPTIHEQKGSLTCCKDVILT